MPPDMAISMRHTKLKAEEVALITGELTKPSWESRNEGIHERVSFEDTIWGFDLAGGSYYRTPLRVTFVKPDSRAEKAGIRPGDRLLRINNVDTSTLTIQEAHDIIKESGMYIRLHVTAPEDLEDAFFAYEDPIVEECVSEEERLRQEEEARRREERARVSSYWSLQWPWVSKRRVIWRESNCYMVPSKYEEKHRDKFQAQPSQKFQEDIVLHSARDTSKNRVRGQKVSNDNEEAVEIKDISDEHSNETVEDDSNHEKSVSEEEVSDANDDVSEVSEVQTEEEAPAQEEIQNIEKKKQDDESSSLEETANASGEEIKRDDEIIDEVLKENDNVPKSEEDNILDSILSDNGQNTENSEAMNER